MAEGKVNSSKWFARIYQVAANIICVLIFLSLVQVSLFRLFDTTFTVSNFTLQIKNLYSKDKYIIPKSEWRSIEDISQNLVKAVLAAEDQRFMSHSGFDYQEMYRAVRDILKGGKIRGASTITMQTARTVFLWQDRTMARKIPEAYYTMIIEFVMPKKRILELYLNTVDWGSGIMGAEAASKKYFNKSASELTIHEAALLAAILKSPHAWSPANPNEQLLERQGVILKSMAKMPFYPDFN